MWAGMWLVVPRSYEQGRENLFFYAILAPDSKSFEVNLGLWIRPLYKQTLFPDKGEKKTWFSLAQRIWVYFFLVKGGRKPQNTFICFPLKIVLWAGEHLSCIQALKQIFSLSSFLWQRRLAAHCPLLSQEHHLPRGERYLPATDRDGAQHKALPHGSFPWQCSQWDWRAALLLWQSVGVSPWETSSEQAANLWGSSHSGPASSFPYLIVKVQSHPSCMVFSLISGQSGGMGWYNLD